VCALALLALATLARGVLVLAREHRLLPALAGGQHELAGPVVLGVVAAVVACERLAPAVRRPLRARGQVQDACYLVVFALVVVPFSTLLGYGADSVLTTWTPWLMLRSTAGLPGWFAVGIALVLMDGCNWLVHLADHKVGALWRVHALHHSQEELSVLTTFRSHPLEHTVSTFGATLPVVVLAGYHPVTPLLITGYLLLGTLPHANVAWRFGPLDRLVVSPAYHRVHHRLEGRQDVNLGIVLSLWDVLAGRAVLPSRGTAPCATGLPGRPLPVEQSLRSYRPVGLLCRQLAEPFTLPGRAGDGGRAAPLPPSGRRREAAGRPPRAPRAARSTVR
jgi:sterol desaturase/sphingolipid hydroxylase (fatty acid hydroxylase superfamily)